MLTSPLQNTTIPRSGTDARSRIAPVDVGLKLTHGADFA